MTDAEIDDIGTFNRISRGSTYDPVLKKKQTYLDTVRSGALRPDIDKTRRREIYHKIGMKFSRQTTTYSFEELKEQGIVIKNP